MSKKTIQQWSNEQFIKINNIKRALIHGQSEKMVPLQELKVWRELASMELHLRSLKYLSDDIEIHEESQLNEEE